MPASPLTEPLAWRGVGAPSRFRDDCRPGLPRPAEDVSRPVRGFRDPHRRFSYRRGARRYGAREPLRSARLFPGRRPAVPIRERAGSDAQHDLALRRSLPIGASTRTCWAPSSPACWSTRSATISAHPMPMWWQSKPRRTEQVRAVTEGFDRVASNERARGPYVGFSRKRRDVASKPRNRIHDSPTSASRRIRPRAMCPAQVDR
jgi:hypothetical protein